MPESPELDFPEVPFPVNIQGHSLSDSEKTVVMGVSLYCFKHGTNAFPAIPLAQRDGLDIRAASNAKFLYFFGKGRLFAINLDEVIASARFHLTGKTEKKAAAKQSDASAGQIRNERRKVTCMTCGEVDVDLFTWDGCEAVGKNGWLISADKALCPDCRAKPKTTA